MKKVSLILIILFSRFLLQAQTIHLISALGADRSIYSNIKLDSSLTINHVNWIKPRKRESIEDYSIRLVVENRISENDIVIGTSFGGIVATEIGKIVQLQKIILISSISSGAEKPPKFKFLKLFRFNKLIPKSMLNNPKIIVKSCFGKVTDKEYEYLAVMIRDYDVNLVYWSLNQIMKFNNKTELPELVKINGNNDKTFPSKYIDSDIILNGTHLMVYNKGEEVSTLLNEIISDQRLIVTLEKDQSQESARVKNNHIGQNKTIRK